MTRTRKTISSLLALALTACFALCTFVVSFAAEPVTETVVVTQVITEGTTPSRSSYTYTLTPKKAENPMPEGTKNGVYTLGPINGATTDANAPTFTLAIDKSQPGVYEYVLERVESTPTGDAVSPESHIFGYQVQVDEKTGDLVVIPYICQSGDPVFSEPDANGYPTKLTLPNVITGKKNAEPTPGQDGKDGQNGKDGVDGKDGQNGTDGKNGTNGTNGRNGTDGKNGTNGTNVVTRTVNRVVNTGDPYQVGLWIGITALAAITVIILGIIRRKKDDEND